MESVTGVDPLPDRPAPTRRSGLGRRALFVVWSLASALLVVAMAWTCLEHWAWRVPSSAERTTIDLFTFALGWVSAGLGFAVGITLTVKAPRNPTGCWLWCAAAGMAGWHIAQFSPVGWLQPLVVGEMIAFPLLAMAFLGYPSGRPSPEVARWVAVVAVGRVATASVGNLFSGAFYPADWPTTAHPWWNPWVVYPTWAASAWLFGVIPALLAAGVLVGRQRRLPFGARRLLRSVTVSGVAVALAHAFSLAVWNLGLPVIFDLVEGSPTVILRSATLAQRSAIGIAAAGLAVGFAGRQRLAGTGPRRLDVDLDRSAAVTAPTTALRDLLADPSAELLFVRPDGTWVDDSGHPSGPDRPGRITTPVCDPRGRPLIGIDLDAARPAAPPLVEVAVATVAGRLASERATAMARSTQQELVAVQHAVLDAADASRRRLERNLHDGAQQSLVGLALAARLAARGGTPDARSELIDQVEHTRSELLALVDSGTPNAVASGLSAGLAALTRSSPVPMSLHVDGDVDGTDRAAGALWYVASDAVANSVKHAGAAHIELTLRVADGVAELCVSDDGRGGVARVPSSIAERVAGVGGAVTVDSPDGRGTSVVARIACGERVAP